MQDTVKKPSTRVFGQESVADNMQDSLQFCSAMHLLRRPKYRSSGERGIQPTECRWATSGRYGLDQTMPMRGMSGGSDVEQVQDGAV